MKMRTPRRPREMVTYIFALRQGKPPGYDRDCFEYLMTGRGFSPEAHRSSTHPLL
ncbi:MAG TPA: hypothetical protein VIK53_02180 [Verrucomicrobiae bacterium]